jgi:UDP:flavonoid glycosyltransferase YjiC (YdhE family)
VTATRYDVIIATDARLPGGTTASVAEELLAQHDAGYRTALVHVPSTLSATARPFSPRLQDLIAAGRCDLVRRGPVRADALIVRHPRVAAELDPDALPPVDVGSVLMIANQAPGALDGARAAHYDPQEANERLAAWSGHEPRWVPIGPLVRRNLSAVAPGLPLAEHDWVNVLDVDRWRVERTGPRSPVRIGRHSRDHELKWPADATSLLAAYPPGFDVRILGGARSARALLGGRLPPAWTVYGFDELPVRRFLAALDVFVYHHHPAWVEAFGRTIIEALAAGLPTVLPPHFAELFGDVAHYTDPAGTAAAVAALTADAPTYLDASARGEAFVAERFSHATHVRRIAALVERSPTAPSREPAPPPAIGGRRRVLFVSSNGAGVGHLMRLLAIARRLPDDVEPVVLTLSQAVGVVRDLGFPVEYLPSRTALDAPHTLWHGLLERRVLALLDEFDIEVVVFDGTWPYNGLVDALAKRPDIRSVWSRRGLWREDVRRHRLDLSDRFTAIIEPGELAAEADRGPTSRRRAEAEQVGPVTFLREAETLDRAESRAALGLEPDGRIALVQLGAGNINDTTSVLGAVTRSLRTLDPALTVCVTRSAIAASGDLPEGVRTISYYPLARVFPAFDLAVAAPGYNTFHELLLAGLPTGFLPNRHTATDDQVARARWAAGRGLAVELTGEDPDTLHRELGVLLRDLEAMQDRLAREISWDDGAVAAAASIARLARTETAGGAAGDQAGGTASGDPARSRPYQLARALFRRLPWVWRQRLLALVRGRFVRGLLVGRRPSPGGSVLSPRLPVPPGAGADASTVAGDAPVGVLIHLAGGPDSDDTATVEGVAAVQQMSGGFRPFFVTESADLRAFRAAGYGVEVLPSPQQLEHLAGPGAVQRLVAERLREIQSSYELDHVVSVAHDDHATLLSVLRGLS